MKKEVIIFITGLLFVSLGIGVLLVGAYIRSNNATQLAQPITDQPVTQQAPPSPAAKQGKPMALTIPDLAINNPVIDGTYDQATRQWTLTDDKVQFATTTQPPNDASGLTFMYGHNRREVFTRLPQIKPGTLAHVTTDNGYVFTYRFTSSTVTQEYDTSIFGYSGKPVLVLQTCVGLFYEHRQLFTFELTGVDRA